MEANYWVIGCGNDCDGYNSGSVAPFEYEEDAYKYADLQNEWSDGISYYVITSLDTLRNYCDDHMKDWKNYITIKTTSI